MKHWAWTLILMILQACQLSDSPGELKADGVVILKDEAIRVDVTDALITHGVRVVLTNYGPDTTVIYHADIQSDDNQWSDSLVFFLETGDTITGEMVFGDALYSDDADIQLKGSLHPIPTP